MPNSIMKLSYFTRYGLYSLFLKSQNNLAKLELKHLNQYSWICLQNILHRRLCFLQVPNIMFCEKISWESIRQRQLLHNFFFVTPKIIDYSYSLSDLTCCTSQVRASIFHYPNGSREIEIKESRI